MELGFDLVLWTLISGYTRKQILQGFNYAYRFDMRSRNQAVRDIKVSQKPVYGMNYRVLMLYVCG